MLVLRRKIGETLLIGNTVEVQILGITKDGQVKVGVTAPKTTNVIRKELKEKLEGIGIPVSMEKAG